MRARLSAKTKMMRHFTSVIIMTMICSVFLIEAADWEEILELPQENTETFVAAAQRIALSLTSSPIITMNNNNNTNGYAMTNNIASEYQN